MPLNATDLISLLAGLCIAGSRNGIGLSGANCRALTKGITRKMNSDN